MVLGAVPVGAVNHHDLPLALLLQSLFCGLDIICLVVRALRASTQDHETVLVSGSPGDCSKTLLRHTHEVVRMARRQHSINGDRQAPVSTVLESDGEGDTTSQLSVELGLGGPCTNGGK